MAVRVGIIGSHGLEQLLGLSGRLETHTLETPFGPHAGPLISGELDGVSVVYVPRHGAGHVFNATRAPYRANLFAMKQLGVTHVLATGTVGSLQEHLPPLQLVVPDQVIDRTYRRPCTFYDDLAVHVELGSPFCGTLRQVLANAAASSGAVVATQATYVCVEGPSLSTRAESLLYRQLGADLVGMTAMPEARLAREAELHYALVALPTDYDSWQPLPPGQEHEALLARLSHNVQAVTAKGAALIRRALPRIAEAPSACRCDSALALALWTERSRIPDEVRSRLRPLLGRYLPPNVV
ncbi:MTAP family purine nucleoside phosphorylase [Myxococcus sp. CA051A]|uniref:MTAP family purine nucleoside phosphorylase n=1 Tax=unclassified Myxococcus TaxID=2648731 RepID=UPI00157BAC9E|nr:MULTISPECIES: MTAP family purine nucleoside phosphorylase [unclassified Myxococcus]NTX15878.1 MTAP family purine nucleoside phosphorylase [Myxococcus sp. CA056]NTX58244.1 MTAP family purine nucleoside phosphorylase [Myxococcus sp. CA039A]NTX65254.1 MTAP family purine nucleoside phosphorylase [Myxococcus sp. CA051A]